MITCTQLKNIINAWLPFPAGQFLRAWSTCFFLTNSILRYMPKVTLDRSIKLQPLVIRSLIDLSISESPEIIYPYQIILQLFAKGKKNLTSVEQNMGIIPGSMMLRHDTWKYFPHAVSRSTVCTITGSFKQVVQQLIRETAFLETKSNE